MLLWVQHDKKYMLELLCTETIVLAVTEAVQGELTSAKLRALTKKNSRLNTAVCIQNRCGKVVRPHDIDVLYEWVVRWVIFSTQHSGEPCTLQTSETTDIRASM